jgi:hypothetical protein
MLRRHGQRGMDCMYWPTLELARDAHLYAGQATHILGVVSRPFVTCCAHAVQLGASVTGVMAVTSPCATAGRACVGAGLGLLGSLAVRG